MSNWIEWKGGDCPVDDACIVDVKFRNGIVANGGNGDSITHAGAWFWGRLRGDGDIIAYRISDQEDAGKTSADGWIKCSDRLPLPRTGVLVACYWGLDAWVMKWGTYCAGHPDASAEGWLIPGASWIPTHWQPLPEPPKE